ncbi:hypothetical protein IVB14_33625 [Bradyrhizobium sp. 180]|uniref:hypothetical protein n=1 Tax=Bradyrhizobium sp. 180 TaxID=2782650 RepID=UPI001FF7E641|nr:hypothetical protein [Bradyrhizobium sp. 180]MCK1495217.1 hypothetical protein [Bradyrhizobium sp. 180]
MTTLRAGDWVEVRSREEILRTLDKNGRLDEMPFMPQMFEYCGQRLRVYKRAHKACDTVNPVAGRRISSSVHLDTRCDGKAYGGCQAACLLFWKEAWLKPVGESAGIPSTSEHVEARPLPERAAEAACSEQEVWKGTRGADVEGQPRYICQATQLPRFTQPLAWWDVRQYVEDYTSGNTSLGRMTRGVIYLFFWHILLAKKRKLGRPARVFYDWFQGLWGGIPFPKRVGTLPVGQMAPCSDLNLQPGDLVRMKSYEEIRATLVSSSNTNRGLSFDAELVPFCGGKYRVKTRVTRFIDEKTGAMKSLKTPAVILENVWCQSRYSDCRMFCPRSIYAWCREAWLERIPEEASHHPVLSSSRAIGSSSERDGTERIVANEAAGHARRHNA